jgi:uracil-DNA glycosylase family 4
MTDSGLSTVEDIHAAVIACRRCPRLVAWREQVAQKRRRAYAGETYWGKAVPGFGDPQARIHVIGLAPGAHGANRTGRNFTGDDSGVFLYRALYKACFASQPTSTRIGDGLELRDIYISAVCRCVAPENKPLPEEIAACRPYLLAEMAALKRVEGIVALGKIAFDGLLATLAAAGKRPPRVAFAHGAFYPLGAGLPWLLATYHPSRQNTNTGRLTEAMFDSIWQRARELLDES